jgi:hypothetical protein
MRADFLSGPTANDVASEYAQTVGLPQVMPFWSFGFHLCRWGYGSLAETKKQVTAMRKAGIPLEVCVFVRRANCTAERELGCGTISIVSSKEPGTVRY